MSKKILLINDMVGYGKVALSAAMPILIHMGYELYNLPSVLISNTLNYGKHAMLDTTQFMKDTVDIWEELGFKYDAMSVGFIANDEQAKWLAGFCEKQKEKGTIVFVDPIMGDNGKLYNSITPKKAECLKLLIGTADYIVPNYTEACCLAGAEYCEDGISEEELYDLLSKFNEVCAASKVITSVPLKKKDGRVNKCVGAYDAKTDAYFTVPYDEIPVKINGSGDTFLAIMMGHLLLGDGLKESVSKSVDGVRALINSNLEYAGSYNGLPIEAALDVL